MTEKRHGYPINSPGEQGGHLITSEPGFDVDIFVTRGDGPERWVTFRSLSHGYVSPAYSYKKEKLGDDERAAARYYDEFIRALGQRPCPLDPAPRERRPGQWSEP